MARRRTADSFVFACGKRGSGKSSWLKQYARGFGRVLVWDPKAEYGQALGIEPIRDLAELVRRCAEPRLVYVPRRVSREVFDFVCKLVFYHRHRSLFLVDELGSVSRHNQIVPHWDLIEREGRHHGIELAGASQRPVMIDSQMIANATRLVVFRLGHERDRTMMAAELGIDPEQLRLPPLEFLDFDVETEALTRRRLVFSR